LILGGSNRRAADRRLPEMALDSPDRTGAAAHHWCSIARVAGRTCGSWSAGSILEKEVQMFSGDKTHRRGFLGRVFGATAGAGLSLVGVRQAAAQATAPDAWMNEVKGTHRALFDFPQHKNGVPLLHILNYLSTYAEAYKTPAGQAGAVGTFYSIGNQSSISLGFNDAMWAKYALGEYLGLKDSTGKAYARNVFYRPTSRCPPAHQAMGTLTIPAFADAMPAIGIESLQKMGTKFLLCANALGIWCLELEARGQGKAADIEKELRGQPVAGRDDRSCMVIAIEKATGRRHHAQPPVAARQQQLPAR
jgi:hypothetical protein